MCVHQFCFMFFFFLFRKDLKNLFYKWLSLETTLYLIQTFHILFGICFLRGRGRRTERAFVTSSRSTCSGRRGSQAVRTGSPPGGEEPRSWGRHSGQLRSGARSRPLTWDTGIRNSILTAGQQPIHLTYIFTFS